MLMKGVPGVERMQTGGVNWCMLVAGVIQCPGRWLYMNFYTPSFEYFSEQVIRYT